MNLEQLVADLTDKVEHRFYGKYRGVVVDNQDPSKLGRLRLIVPSVLGKDVVTGWATPCAPYGGAPNLGFLFIPDKNAGVWTEFEEGDLEFPIWSGSFWCRPDATSEAPRPNDGVDGSEEGSIQSPPISKIIKTASGHTLQFEDASGSEMVLIREGRQGHFMTMDGDGITVSDASANTIRLTDRGITITDKSQNLIEMTADGIKMTGPAGNIIDLSTGVLTITAGQPLTIDAGGQPVTVIGSSVDFKQG
jgi:hypothetical protein